MKLRLLVIALLVAVGGAAIAISMGGLPSGSGAGATEYLTAAATTGDVTAEVAATGTVAPGETWALGFGAGPVLATGDGTAAGSGTWTVTSVTARPGAAVKAGDTLATASTEDLEDQLRIAKTSLNAARVQERAANDALDDANDTEDTATIRQAKISQKNALNARRQAQQEVADLRDQISLATITAPIDGLVTAVNAVEGQSLTGTAITLASATYEVTTDVPESDIGEMAVGQPATVTVGAIDATVQGEVTAIAPAASDASGSSGVVSFPVTVTLSGAPSALKSGMTAEVTIVSASVADVLTVPTAALRGTTGNYRVLVLGADGTPQAREVTVGLVTDGTTEITGGLAEGEVVVTGTSSSLTATGGGGGATQVVGGFGGPGGGGGGPRTIVTP